MSDVYVSYVGHQTYKKPGSFAVQEQKSQNIENWYPRAVCEWTPTLKDELLSFFTKLDYPFRTIEEIPFKDPLRSEIRRFFISLDAYIESPRPVIPYKDILYGSTDIDYAKTLKKIKRKSLLTTWQAELFEQPEWWPDVPSYIIEDIGDIFNFNYLIFWNEDVDDYKYGFEPVEIDSDAISSFKESLRDILPLRKSFERIKGFDVLSDLSSSSSFNRKLRKTQPHYLMKPDNLAFSTKRQLGKRSVIPVGPENIRDTVILDPQDLNTISLIDLQVMEIIRQLPGHIHLRDKERVNKRLKSFFNKHSDFLHRDMKKEGITKPRELLRAMLEVLHDEYPDISIFENTHFYDNYPLLVENEIINPPRGHGLGMANALTTLMQLAIHNIIIDELTDDIPDIHGKILCINDDFVAGFNSEEHLEAYWDKEDEVMGKLSVLREPNKSFRTRHCFVLAERYLTSRGEYEKTSYQLREMLLPLACFNVTHAKSYFVASQTYVNSKYVSQYLGEIQSYWGFEFYPDEFRYPSIVGGWINEKVNSVDMSLVSLDQLELKSFVFRGFKAAKTNIYKRGKGEIYNSPSVILLGNPHIQEGFENFFDKLPISLITEKYGRPLKHSRRNFKNFWESVYKARQRVFKKPFECTYEELLVRIKESYPATQFYPNESMIKCYHEGDIVSVNIKDVYIDPNPKLACISKFNETQYEFKETFSIRFTKLDESKNREFQLFPKEINRALKNEFLNQLFTGKESEIYYPRDLDLRPQEWYINPIKIGEVTSLINWGYGYPEPYDKFKDALVKEKKEIFNYLFSLNELIMISRSGISRSNLKRIVDFVIEEDESLIETLEFLCSNMETEEPEYIPPPEDDEPSEEEIFKNFHRSRPPPPVEEGITYVPNTALKEEGLPMFYLYQNADPETFQFENEAVRSIFDELRGLVIDLTFPGLRTVEERERLVEEYNSHPDILVRLAFISSGIASLLEADNSFPSDDDGDGPFSSLFGD